MNNIAFTMTDNVGKSMKMTFKSVSNSNSIPANLAIFIFLKIPITAPDSAYKAQTPDRIKRCISDSNPLVRTFVSFVKNTRRIEANRAAIYGTSFAPPSFLCIFIKMYKDTKAITHISVMNEITLGISNIIKGIKPNARYIVHPEYLNMSPSFEKLMYRTSKPNANIAREVYSIDGSTLNR